MGDTISRMASSQPVSDTRPWDRKLVDWMSRGSDTAGSRGEWNPYWAAAGFAWAVVFAVAWGPVWYAIGLALLGSASWTFQFRRHRARRQRQLTES
jgi:Flp pilus assembly protein TadB